MLSLCDHAVWLCSQVSFSVCNVATGRTISVWPGQLCTAKISWEIGSAGSVWSTTEGWHSFERITEGSRSTAAGRVEWNVAYASCEAAKEAETSQAAEEAASLKTDRAKSM